MRGDVYIQTVLDKCEALQQSRLWPPDPQVKPSGWLQNFTDGDDRVLAAVLLDHLVYFSDTAVDQLLAAAFNRLEDSGFAASLLSGTLITPIEGEDPNPTDSGFMFCRKARIAGVPEKQILHPPDALDEASRGAPIIFLDDFIGTGAQFGETWNRNYLDDSPMSFSQAHTASPFPVFVVALVVTAEAVARIRRLIPDVTIVATHILAKSYNAKSLITPTLTPSIGNYTQALHSFLQRYSADLTLKDFMREGDFPLYGFGSKALLLGFEHSIPDSALPILWAQGPAPWVQLLKPR